MRRIKSTIITGATGAIGLALCRTLVSKGIRVIAIVRPGSARNRRLEGIDDVETIECDVADLRHISTKEIGGSVDAFFHLAWLGTTGDARNDMDMQVRNIQYALDAVQAAKTLGCTVFIGAGSQAEYGCAHNPLTATTPCFPENGYGMAKLCAGQMSRVECAKLGISHIWPRILSVYGPGDGENSMITSVIKKLIRRERPSLTPGDQLWDYLYADDATEALYALAIHGRDGAVYPLGSGQARPLKEYITELRDAIDPSLPLGFGEIDYAPRQVMHLEADIGDITADTGWKPRTNFEDGIKKTINWVKSNERA